jgi:hypothetical protein
MKKSFAVIGLTLVVSVAALTGCSTSGGTAAPAPTPTESATNPYGGFPVDPPAATDIVLTVTGTSTVDFTYAQLQELATEQVAIHEPFVGKDQTFSGIPLADLLARAGIAPTDKVDTVALNDYHFADTAAKLEDAKAVLAVLRSGSPIPMDQGGPIRLIFPTDSSYYSYLDAWNWSLRSIVKAG